MAVPLLYKISKHRVKLIFMFVLTLLFLQLHNKLDSTSAIPAEFDIGSIAKPIGKSTPKLSESTTEPTESLNIDDPEPTKQQMDPGKVHPGLTKDATSLPGTPQSTIAPTLRMPRLPPKSSDESKVDTPKFRASKKGFVDFNDPKYENLEIVPGPAKSTRMSLKKSQDASMLPAVKVPRIPKFQHSTNAKIPGKLAGRKLPKIQAEKFDTESAGRKKIRMERKAAIKNAMNVSWTAYKDLAWGMDELKPVSKKAYNPFAGWAAMLVDALDTLWIMGFRDEFDEAVDLVRTINFTQTFRDDIPVFETVIRYLGGLLAAYDLSGETVLLEKAVQLGDNLMGAFDTPNGIPQVSFLWTESYANRKFRASTSSSFAEIGSLSVEFTRLAQATGNNTYYSAIERVTTAIYDLAQESDIKYLIPPILDASGCYFVPISEENTDSSTASVEKADETSLTETSEVTEKPSVDPEIEYRKAFPEFQKLLSKGDEGKEADLENEKSGEGQVLRKRLVKEDHRVLRQFGQGRSVVVGCDSAPALKHPVGSVKYTLGGLADSSYEYFPKQHILLQGFDPRYEELYTGMVAAVNESMLFRPWAKDDPDVLFIGNIVKRQEFWQQDNEVTHLSCFVGGMYALGAKLFESNEELAIAAKLTDGCLWAANQTRTGIMPENFHIRRCPIEGPCHFEFENINELAVQDSEERMLRAQKEGKVTEAHAKIYSASTNLRSPTVAVTEDGRWPVMCNDLPRSFIRSDPRYALRPEVIESVFYMYRVTGDRTWQDKGWALVENILKWCAVKDEEGTVVGYSGLSDVTKDKVGLNDEQESFWMAETLKYAYLLFEEEDQVSLDNYVFNTEAHPMLRPDADL